MPSTILPLASFNPHSKSARLLLHLVGSNEPAPADFIHFVPSSVAKAWTRGDGRLRGIPQSPGATSRGRCLSPRRMGRTRLEWVYRRPARARGFRGASETDFASRPPKGARREQRENRCPIEIEKQAVTRDRRSRLIRNPKKLMSFRLSAGCHRVHGLAVPISPFLVVSLSFQSLTNSTCWQSRCLPNLVG
jgi:hypothetical protein